MFQLPNNEHLPIHKLVACFNNTSATYKFYWLLAASCFNDEPKSHWSDWNGIITPREEPHSPDALSIIENWLSIT